MVSRIASVATGDRMVPAGARIGRRQFLTSAAAGIVLASSMPSRAFAAQTPVPVGGAPWSVLDTMLRMLPAEAVAFTYGGLTIEFFLPAVSRAALAGHVETYTAFAPNPHSLSFDRMPGRDQVGEMFAVVPDGIEGFVVAGDLMLIRGSFDRELTQAAWTALGYLPGDDPEIFAFHPSDPDRASDELSELHDRLQLPGRYGMWEYLSLPHNGTVVCADDPDLIVASRDLARDPSQVLPAGLREAVGRDDTPWLSMGRIRLGDRLVAPDKPERANDRTRRIDERNEAALATIESELGPMPALDAMLVGSTPGAPWVPDGTPRFASGSATYVALIAPESPADAGAVLEIVQRRFEETTSWRHEQPFTDLLSLDLAEVDEANGLARLEFSQVGERRWDLEYFLYFEDAPFLYADPA